MSELKLLKCGPELYIGKESNGQCADGYTGCFLVRYQMTPQGMQVGIMPPFAPFSDESISLSKDQVLAAIDAPEDMKNAYIQSTTGIQIAPANTPGLKLV